MLKKISLQVILPISLFFSAGNSFAHVLQCPSIETIQIVPNHDPLFPDDPVSWIGPHIDGFRTTTAPQQGTIIKGPVSGVQAIYLPAVSMFDLLCLYPTNATTTRVPLPPLTGYIAYRLYNVPKDFCVVNKDNASFTCGE